MSSENPFGGQATSTPPFVTQELPITDPNVQSLYILAGRLGAWADRVREEIEADLDSAEFRSIAPVTLLAGRADETLAAIRRERYAGRK